MDSNLSNKMFYYLFLKLIDVITNYNVNPGFGGLALMEYDEMESSLEIFIEDERCTSDMLLEIFSYFMNNKKRDCENKLIKIVNHNNMSESTLVSIVNKYHFLGDSYIDYKNKTHKLQKLTKAIKASRNYTKKVKQIMMYNYFNPKRWAKNLLSSVDI